MRFFFFVRQGDLAEPDFFFPFFQELEVTWCPDAGRPFSPLLFLPPEQGNRTVTG